MSSHRSRKVFALGLGLLMIALAIVCAVLAFVPRGPLKGETSHDFGTVVIPSAGLLELQHTFHLTNRTSRPITVAAVKPDCGCVAAHAGATTVQPREAFDIPITLTLRSRSKHVMITLDLGDDGLESLFVYATGRFAPRLLLLSKEITLDASGNGQVQLVLEQYDASETPRNPALSVPSVLSAQFSGWSIRTKPSNPSITPYQWMGTLAVKRMKDEVSADAAIVVEFPAAAAVTIPVRAAPQNEQPNR